jgi:uncharacterized membrane protein YecN with MAPEG domain
MPITLLYAGLLGLMAVFLANQVLHARLQGRRAPEWKADATMRTQINFAENVPISLVLLYVLETSGLTPSAIHAFGGSLVLVRLLHAWGMASNPTAQANYPRLIGAQGTFLLMSIMAMTAIYRYLMW